MKLLFFFFFSSRRRHTRYWRDWSLDVCSSDLNASQRPCCQLAWPATLHLWRDRLPWIDRVLFRFCASVCRSRATGMGGLLHSHRCDLPGSLHRNRCWVQCCRSHHYYCNPGLLVRGHTRLGMDLDAVGEADDRVSLSKRLRAYSETLIG